MIMVTGASGLLGSTMIVVARERGEEATGVYHTHPVAIPGGPCVRADLTREEEVSQLVARFEPDWIIHTAALTSVDYCEDHPEEARLANREATRLLAEAARDAGSFLVYISTDSVFDGARGGYREEDDPGPLNVYAKSKLAGEEAVRRTLRRYLILRTSIYGWNLQRKLSLAEWMLAQLESGEPITAFTDASFSPILVNDLAEVILDMRTRALSGLYHAGGSEPTSKYGFACVLADVFGLRKDLIQPGSVDEADLRARRPKNISLATEKITRDMGRSMPGIRSGLSAFRSLRESGFAGRLKSYGRY